MALWILVMAADLVHDTDQVIVGPETARVCDRAADEWHQTPGAYVCATAGRSGRFGVYMGNGPMRTYLYKSGCVPSSCLITPIDPQTPFTTDGEVQTFVNVVHLYDDHHPRIRVVVREWHAPRTRKLLERRLRESGITAFELDVIPVPSHAVFDRFITEPIKRAMLFFNWVAPAQPQPDSS